MIILRTAGHAIDVYAILAFCFFMFSTIYSLPLRFRGVLPWHRLFRSELDHAINNTNDPEDLRQLKIAKKVISYFGLCHRHLARFNIRKGFY